MWDSRGTSSTWFTLPWTLSPSILLDGPDGLPKHLRAEPKVKIDARGAKLVAVENCTNKHRQIASIEELTSARNGEKVEIRMRVTWKNPRFGDNPEERYLLNPEDEEDYNFL